MFVEFEDIFHMSTLYRSYAGGLPIFQCCSVQAMANSATKFIITPNTTVRMLSGALLSRSEQYMIPNDSVILFSLHGEQEASKVYVLEAATQLGRDLWVRICILGAQLLLPLSLTFICIHKHTMVGSGNWATDCIRTKSLSYFCVLLNSGQPASPLSSRVKLLLYESTLEKESVTSNNCRLQSVPVSAKAPRKKEKKWFYRINCIIFGLRTLYPKILWATTHPSSSFP